MRRYSLAQLEAFAAIVRLGSFQAAAQHLHITQPTVSLRVRELEDALGTRLFDREGRSSKLNAEGVVALDYADQVLTLLDELETRLRTDDPLTGVLRVGSSEMIAIAVLPKIIALLDEQYPNLKVELTVSNSFALLDRIASNTLDVALLSTPERPASILVESLAVAPVAWVGSRSKALPDLFVDPDILQRRTILCMPSPSPLHEMMIDWWKAEGRCSLRVSTCNSLAMLAKLVKEGVGMGVMPTCILRDEIQSGCVIRYLQNRPFSPLQICAAYPKSTRSEGIGVLVRIARSVMLDSQYFSPPSP